MSSSCARWSQVSDRLLPYGHQWVSAEDIDAVAAVLSGEYLTTGPTIGAFEAALAEVSGVSQVVSVASGTAALHAMYSAVGIRSGDEVIVPPLTFAATANAALYLGANPRFVDVDARTGLIAPDAVAEVATSRTRAVVAVDFAGHPADYDALRAVIDPGTALLADASHSLGATRGDRPAGSLADATAFSFHPVKPITTGEGGAIATDNPDVAAAAARFRTHGITRDRSLMGTDEGEWYYEQVDLGFNYRLTDIQAALGLSQLSRLNAFLSRRRTIAQAYLEAFAGLAGVGLPMVENAVSPGWHLFVIRVAANRRRSFFDRLRADGLGVQVHYIPVYWHPLYRDLGYQRGQCPTAEAIYGESISLPIFPAMTDGDVDRVITAVAAAAADLL